MPTGKSASRRQALRGAGVGVALALTSVLPTNRARAHQGHDHAPRTILDLKGKLVRIVGGDAGIGEEFIQDCVTIRVDADGRIVDLRYG
jgi:hypothetical protein